MALSDQDKIAVAREYFIRADQGRADVLDLLDEDAEIYFPKFGFGHGRNSLFEMVKGFEGVLKYIKHDYDNLIFIPSGDHLVVEGTSEGESSNEKWTGGKTPGGRFCNAVKFRNDPNLSLHFYLHPDYTRNDSALFRYGKNPRS